MELTTPPEIFDRTLDLLEELTGISSPSGDPDGLRRAAECLGRSLERCGLATEIRDQEGMGGEAQPVLYARGPACRGPAAKESYLLIIGHLDTVLSGLVPERRGQRLYATGAIDMKGGLAAFVGALELLAAQGRRPPEDLLVAVVPDEEVAGPLSYRVMEDLGPAARGLWVLEPGTAKDGGETVVLARRGMFHWRLEVLGRGAHAGNDYWSGRSALNAAAEWCLEAQKLARPGRGPTVNAGRLIAGDESFVRELGSHADLVGTTRQINVVPNMARVEGEVRFFNRGDAERLPEAMKALAARVGTLHEVETLFWTSPPLPPFEPGSGGREWSQRVVEIAERHGWRIVLDENRGGISFPNFLPDPAAIPILDGLGPVGDGMHTREEYVDLGSFDRRITLLAELLAADREGPAA